MRANGSFWISFLSLLILPAFSPATARLLFFAPYLVQGLSHPSLFSLLVRATLCGCFVDLFSSSTLFGTTALNYAFVSLILQRKQAVFFSDKSFTLPLLTFFFSFLSTLLTLLFSFISSSSVPLTLSFFLTDLVAMPLCDGVYAYLGFVLPFQINRRIRRLIPRRRSR